MNHSILDTSDTKLAELPEPCQIHKGISFVVCPHCAIETASGLIDKLEILVNDLDAERKRLTAENQRQRAALDAVWEALDGLYGADSGEELPIDLLPQDRQQLFHKALELVGGTFNREQLQ